MAADPLTALRAEIVAHGGLRLRAVRDRVADGPRGGEPARRASCSWARRRAPPRTSSGGRSWAAPGKLLDELLAEAGLVREDVWITNVVKARPPKNRDPKAPEVAHCMPWLRARAGAHPAAPGRAARAARAEALRARRRRSPRSTGRLASTAGLFPLYHPAAAMYNQTLQATLFEDARALGDRLRE